VDPFEYQQQAMDAIERARRSGPSALVVLAMGLGKTAVSAFWVRDRLAESPGRVLWLCHDTEILRQARSTFETIVGPRRSYGFFHGSEKHLHSVDVLFASFQTMATRRTSFDPAEFRYVIVDEAHHAAAPTYLPTIRYFRPEFLLGMTATPERADGQPVTAVFGQPVMRMDVPEAIAHGHLARIDYRLMTDEIVNTGVLATPAGQLSAAKLNRSIFLPMRDEKIISIIVGKTAGIEHPHIVVFCHSVSHAERMATLMPGTGVVLHSRLSAEEKHRRMTAFRTGAAATVFVVDMFNEGIDVPEVNVLVFLRSTASETIYLQQLGRGLRKAPGKTQVLVLDFVANCERITMITKLRDTVHHQTHTITTPDGGSTPEPLTLRLDSDGDFDERVLGLVELVRRIGRDYTRDELAALLNDKIRTLGRVPSRHQLHNDPDFPGPGVYERVFQKSWTAILLSLGHKPLRQDYTRQDLIPPLLAKAQALGRAPTLDEVDADPAMAATATYTRTFGVTWSDILESLGLQSRRKNKYTRTDLEKLLISKIESLGRMPTLNEVTDDPDLPSPDHFIKIYGMSWTRIARYHGQTHKRTYTKPELAELLHAKAATLGRTPTSTEVSKDPDLPSLNTFLRTFDTTWNGILNHLNLPTPHPKKAQAQPPIGRV